MAAINVNATVKVLVEGKAKEVCKLAGLKDKEFNQDLNAYAINAALRSLGVTYPKDKQAEVLMVLKKGGNASALRQAITSVAKADEKVLELNEALLKLGEVAE